MINSFRKNKIKEKQKMNEIFKDVPGFEGFYQVSNFGNVKSNERKYWRETSYHSGHWATRREKMLTPMPDKERICPC